MARKSNAGPATDPEVLILSSLAGGPKHGYAIMTDIETFAQVELGPGTLYAAITRLVENEWVEPLRESGRQRPYRITPKGYDRLQAQLERMRQLANFGLRRLKLA
jgi:DNA-binding PadR family transcriptional regulator